MTGYLPQFVNGDATKIGFDLVTTTETQDIARNIIGLGLLDSIVFNDVTIKDLSIVDDLVLSGLSSDDPEVYNRVWNNSGILSMGNMV